MDIMRDAGSVCEALRELGGSATRASIWEALSDPPSGRGERTEILAYAERQGWISLTPRRVELTPKGASRFGPQHLSRESVTSIIAEPDYEPPRELYRSVLNRLPVAHGFFVDVICSQIIARYHLASIRRGEWPGNMTIGGSGTGKTTINKLVCRLFDMDIVSHTVDMTQAQTLGALRGLHVPTHGFQPSHYMSYPYLAFEEMDKTQGRFEAADAYFRGEINQETRGKRYQILPVPVIYANPPKRGGEMIKEGEEKYSILHPAWRRRSFVLDTDYMSPDQKSEVEDFAAWLDTDENLSPGILVRENFRVNSRLSDEGKAILQNARELLTVEFRNRDLWPGYGPLELAALGMAALYGIDDKDAAWKMGKAYLSITATIPGQVSPYAVKIWDDVKAHAGETAVSIREFIRAEIKKQDAKSPRAVVVKPPTLQEQILIAAKLDADKDNIIRMCGNMIQRLDTSELDKMYPGIVNPFTFTRMADVISFISIFKSLASQADKATTTEMLMGIWDVIRKMEAEAQSLIFNIRHETEALARRLTAINGNLWLVTDDGRIIPKDWSMYPDFTNIQLTRDNKPGPAVVGELISGHTKELETEPGNVATKEDAEIVDADWSESEDDEESDWLPGIEEIWKREIFPRLKKYPEKTVRVGEFNSKFARELENFVFALSEDNPEWNLTCRVMQTTGFLPRYKDEHKVWSLDIWLDEEDEE